MTMRSSVIQRGIRLLLAILLIASNGISPGVTHAHADGDRPHRHDHDGVPGLSIPTRTRQPTTVTLTLTMAIALNKQSLKTIVIVSKNR